MISYFNNVKCSHATILKLVTKYFATLKPTPKFYTYQAFSLEASLY